MAIHREEDQAFEDVVLKDGRIVPKEVRCAIIVMEELCENLKPLRKTLNITQEELAGQVGISRQSVINYEAYDFYEDGYMEKSILIALIAYFSLRPKSAILLKSIGFYENPVVNSYGFTEKLCDFIITQVS
ncbi:MAG: helix-turn-helix transcriptional regulator [Methanomassiliicoccales archaeon]|jgi:DNA-binding XRE family transcriptional regulator